MKHAAISLLSVLVYIASTSAQLPAGFGQIQSQLRGELPDNGASFQTNFTNLPSASPGQYGDARYVVGQNNLALSTLSGSGVAQGVVELQGCALWSPHYHPRGNEVLYVSQGNLKMAFVEENQVTINGTVFGGRTLNYTVSSKQSLVIPQGLIHYIYNPMCTPATVITFFDNKDPGTTSIVQALFFLSDNVVSAATGLDVFGVNLARKQIGSASLIGVDKACQDACTTSGAPAGATAAIPPSASAGK